MLTRKAAEYTPNGDLSLRILSLRAHWSFTQPRPVADMSGGRISQRTMSLSLLAISCFDCRALHDAGAEPMRRRDVITGIVGSAAGWPLAARAAPADRVRHVGVIMGFAEDDEVWQAYLAAFRQRLQDFGWSEGRNIRFDYRFTGESTQQMRVAASEVVAMAPDLIFVSTNPVVSALREVNRTIPTVFTWVSEPVGSGYVTSLAHPGGNITGFQNYEPALGAKWMGILKEIAPAMRRVAFVHVPEIIPNVAFMRAGEGSSGALGISVSGAGVRNVADIERELTQFAQGPHGGLIITPSPLTATRRSTIIELAERLHLPAIYPFRFYAASGGMMSYGIDQTELVREAASYVDRILRGTKPADLPVQLSTRYQLVINMKTATALGLNVPNSMRLLSDEMIE